MQPKTLQQAKRMAVGKAFSDLVGFSDPFGAVQWMRTLPQEWQGPVHEVIIHVYHHETSPPLGEPSQKRFLLLVGEGGYLTCLRAGDPRRQDRYKAWTILATIHRPLTPDLVRQAQLWAVRHYDV